MGGSLLVWLIRTRRFCTQPTHPGSPSQGAIRSHQHPSSFILRFPVEVARVVKCQSKNKKCNSVSIVFILPHSQPARLLGLNPKCCCRVPSSSPLCRLPWRAGVRLCCYTAV